MIKKPLTVIFFDESSFAQFSCSGRVWVWRSPDQEFWMNRLQSTVKHGGFSVMVWGAIWHDGKSELVVCEGRINSTKYMEILKEGLLPIFLPVLMLTRTIIFSWKMVPLSFSKNDTSLASRKWHRETLVAKSVTRYESN